MDLTDKPGVIPGKMHLIIPRVIGGCIQPALGEKRGASEVHTHAITNLGVGVLRGG